MIIGFVEGEGTFGYKHLAPYFQIAQHKKNLFVLEAIEKHLLKLLEQDPNNEQVASGGIWYKICPK